MIYPTFDSLLQCPRQRQVSDKIKDNRYADFLMGNCRGHLTRLQGALKFGQTVILPVSGGIFLRYPFWCEQASSSQAKTWIQRTGQKGWLCSRKSSSSRLLEWVKGRSSGWVSLRSSPAESSHQPFNWVLFVCFLERIPPTLSVISLSTIDLGTSSSSVCKPLPYNKPLYLHSLFVPFLCRRLRQVYP